MKKILTGLNGGLGIAKVSFKTGKACNCRIVGTHGTEYTFTACACRRSLEFIPMYGESYTLYIDAEDEYIHEVAHSMAIKNLSGFTPLDVGIAGHLQGLVSFKQSTTPTELTVAVGADSFLTAQLESKAVVEIISTDIAEITYNGLTVRSSNIMLVVQAYDILNIVGKQPARVTVRTYEPY